MAAAKGPYGDPLADDTAIASTLHWFAAELAQHTRRGTARPIAYA